jgi:hypothetical protein
MPARFLKALQSVPLTISHCKVVLASFRAYRICL